MKRFNLILLLSQALTITAIAGQTNAALTEKDVYHCIDLDGGSRFDFIIYTDMDGERASAILENKNEHPIDFEKVNLTSTAVKNQFRFYYLSPGSDEQTVICTYDKKASSRNVGLSAKL